MARILVIDDDDAIRRIAEAVLTRAGHTVQLAADGRAGITLFRQAPADVVITDLVMPGQEGMETIRALRHDFPSVPIIAISGAVEASMYLGMASRIGAQEILAKPFTMEALLAAVERALARSSSH